MEEIQTIFETSREKIENDENSTKKITFSPSIPQKKEKTKIIPKKEKSKRVITNHKSWQKDVAFETQYNILKEVKTQYNDKNPYHKCFISQIKQKINGYFYQDEKKDKLNKDSFVDLSNVLQKLIDSNMECYYCKKKIKVLYEYVREEDQWTLERIDNKKGHNIDNIEIACLSCNLRRRTMYHERYLFTKQMNIVKL
jgi:hypothetical protein